MKKEIKIAGLILVFLVVFPALAGTAIMYLWNNILTIACGFAAITFFQSVGLFILGQIVGGGFVLGLLVVGGGMRRLSHADDGFAGPWSKMTEGQRREFIQRRREFFGFNNKVQSDSED